MTHRKEFWAVFTVIVAAAAVLVYFAARAVGQVDLLEAENAANITAIDTANWTPYTNAQFGFSLGYPPNWQLFTGGLSAAAPFIALGNPLSGTSTYVVYLYIEQNPDSLSSGDYAHQILAADRAEDASSSGTAPTVTPQFQSSYLVNVNGIPAYEFYNVFEFDHNAERIYVARGIIALDFDFPVAAANPNIAAPANNNAIAHMIMSTLTFN